jgi:hypothetical protein
MSLSVSSSRSTFGHGGLLGFSSRAFSIVVLPMTLLPLLSAHAVRGHHTSTPDTVYWGLKRLLSVERASRVASPGR